MNFYSLLGEDQQANQTAWFEDVLTQSQVRGEKVIVIGHIPSGHTAPDGLSQFGGKFNRLLRRFGRDTIVGQFFG